MTHMIVHIPGYSFTYNARIAPTIYEGYIKRSMEEPKRKSKRKTQRLILALREGAPQNALSALWHCSAGEHKAGAWVHTTPKPANGMS